MDPLRIVLTTCRRWPELSRGDRPLLAELTRRGHHVSAQPWNDAPRSAFTAADLIVLRSNWDFHHEIDAFDEWLTAIEDSDARLVNSAALVRAHNDKGYLERYAELGIRTPATLRLARFDTGRIERWMDERRFSRVVIKPAWGASGHDVVRVGRDDLRAQQQRWELDAGRRALLIQEFIPGINAGEYSLVFFGGEYSHALLRMPSAADFRVNSAYGGHLSLAETLPPGAIEFGARVIAALPTPAVYARIDVVGADDGFVLMEVEVNEPAVGLDLAPGSGARFADALS